MIYFIKRKYKQIVNIIKWIPILWNQFDFDYSYSINVFKYQLQKQSDFLNSKNAHTVNAKHNAQRINMVIKLMDKVYNEDYGCEYQKKLRELYGDDILDIDISSDRYLKYKYEILNDKKLINEINIVRKKLFEESQQKQKRAHKLLWDLIEHNIQHWWD